MSASFSELRVFMLRNPGLIFAQFRLAETTPGFHPASSHFDYTVLSTLAPRDRALTNGT
jgi:hypothetical protein